MADILIQVAEILELANFVLGACVIIFSLRLLMIYREEKVETGWKYIMFAGMVFAIHEALKALIALNILTMTKILSITEFAFIILFMLGLFKQIQLFETTMK